ncbi:MAG: tyrosine-type recombinase/integrase, partial [Pseudonocardiaceae bacterium]|nr:tyrosine-type recombinase/integrase [Pseudonocardiaceae bacterium]
TGAAIDRYLRARRREPRVETPMLWLGDRGLSFGYAGLAKQIKGRAAAARIDRFHLHMLRHTFAGRWLSSGGSEQGLMVTAGWSRREMIDRYSRATSERRAQEESRRLGLGDL